MRKLTVEAFEDHSRPGGGHAVIRLKGLSEVPDNLAFRLRPADGSAALDRPGSWPDGERQPLSTRVTAEGCELLVGPDIVESPQLLPGTLAIIDIPMCGVRGEFLWPRIQPITRPRRRHLVKGRAATKDIAEAVPAATAAAGTAPGAHGATSDGTDPAERAEAVARAARNAEAWQAPLVVEAQAPAGGAKTGEGGSTRDPASAASEGGAGSDRDPAKRRSGRWLGQAAIVLAAFAGGAMLTKWAPQPWQLIERGVAASGTKAGPVDASFPRGSELMALIDVAKISPRGLDGSNPDSDDLLARADKLLNGTAATRDPEEARYMLRRYLAVNLGNHKSLWVLTQLGSLHAEPGKGRAPDYARAASIWEMAATLGDPIAMCFLSRLHEHGLGAAADHAAALSWALRSQAAGGCPGLETTIARLRK